MAEWEEVLKEDLRRDEGLRLKAYQCTAGVWTIGFGTTRWFDGKPVRKGMVCTREEADELLERDMQAAISDARRAVSSFDELDGPRKTVMANMSYNLGFNRLSEFKNTIRSVNVGDYKDAALRMMQSKWAAQVGQRASRLSKRMATGAY